MNFNGLENDAHVFNRISYLCNDDWLFSVENTYCDYPYNVDCGDRPLCDANDQNCEERK